MPTAEKLVLPQGYGQTTETLTWEQVRAQLEQAKQYWLATNRGDRSPHLVPVDGLWVDDLWYYGGSPATTQVQRVRANPQVTMHLPRPVDGRGGVGTSSRVEQPGMVPVVRRLIGAPLVAAGGIQSSTRHPLSPDHGLLI